MRVDIRETGSASMVEIDRGSSQPFFSAQVDQAGFEVFGCASAKVTEAACEEGGEGRGVVAGSNCPGHCLKQAATQ